MADEVKAVPKKYKVSMSVELIAPSIDDAREELEKMDAAKLREQLAASIQRVPKGKSPSRADRLGEAEAAVEDAKGIVEELKDEINSWYENLPESFKSGDKGEALQECESQLDEIISNLENVDFGSVEFPGMY